MLWGSLGVAAIVIIASTVYILESPPPPSITVQMALLPEEIGANWQAQITDKPYALLPDEHYFDNAASYSKVILWNGTDEYSYQVEVWLVYWKDSANANHVFEYILGQYQSQNLTNVNSTIGDRAFLYHDQYYNIYMDFLDGNIECWLHCDGSYYQWGQPWWVDATILIAQLQLEKIDHYLAG
jgi:hypothetical protein